VIFQRFRHGTKGECQQAGHAKQVKTGGAEEQGPLVAFVDDVSRGKGQAEGGDKFGEADKPDGQGIS
jgi:hypothetical protein